METLIPATGTCVSRMTGGERRLAERLEQKLDDDYLLWYDVLHQRQMPVEMRRGPGDFDPTSNTIKVMTMKVSKGSEFPVVALTGVGHMPATGEDEKEAAQVFYVAATRATQRSVMGVGGNAEFGRRLET